MKTTPESPSTPAEVVSPGSDAATEADRWLRCSACGARVVRERARLVVNGSHEHVFMNPSAIRFVLGCWSSDGVIGCRSEGGRSTVWTWFPGYAWQIEVCRACQVHLGWSFHAASTFFGLLRDRLV